MNIVLTGFMGTGKSALGRRLAKALGLSFIDTDKLVEARAGGLTADGATTGGTSISEIFGEDGSGEPRFRELEREVVDDLTANYSDAVVATGGGMVLDDDNRRKLRAWGMVILLTASVEDIVERVGRNANRPLIKSGGDVRGYVEGLLNERAPAYADCDITVCTRGKGLDELTEEVLGLLKK